MTWVFGYGSLMWRPGFDYETASEGVLHGYHRAFCVYSHVHRGTPKRPGLVLGLDRGGSCRGMAFRVDERRWQPTLDYLRAREQVTMIYLERQVPVRLSTGERVEAVTYVVDRAHQQYAGRLSIPDQVRLVRQGVGQSGPNPEYVANTVGHLEDMGVVDGPLHDLQAALMAANAGAE